MDTNHDHRLDIEEFVRGAGVVGVRISRRTAERQFRQLDENRYVSRDKARGLSTFVLAVKTCSRSPFGAENGFLELTDGLVWLWLWPGRA